MFHLIDSSSVDSGRSQIRPTAQEPIYSNEALQNLVDTLTEEFANENVASYLEGTTTFTDQVSVLSVLCLPKKFLDKHGQNNLTKINITLRLSSPYPTIPEVPLKKLLFAPNSVLPVNCGRD
jgi:hypothetical protein